MALQTVGVHDYGPELIVRAFEYAIVIRLNIYLTTQKYAIILNSLAVKYLPDCPNFQEIVTWYTDFLENVIVAWHTFSCH